MSRTTSYRISLDLEQSDETRRTITQIESSLSRISDNAKDAAKGMDVAANLETAKKNAEKLAAEIERMAEGGEDAVEQIAAYGKAASRTIGELEKQNSKMLYSTTENGKQDRERLAVLRAQLDVAKADESRKAEAKRLAKEIKDIEKRVVDLSDDELEKAILTNRQTRARLRTAEMIAKSKMQEVKLETTFGKLVKDDLQILKEKLKTQWEFVKSLKDTAKQYALIKKAAVASLKGGAKIAAKGAGMTVKGIGMAGMAAGAIGGMAIAGAEEAVNREREARRIKGGYSEAEKQQILSDVYIQTGMESAAIVEAIGRVQTVLGHSLKRDELVQAARAELMFPGAAAMFRQNTKGNVGSESFLTYANRMRKIQGQTGASVEQVTASTEKIANMRQSSFSNASMTDLQAVYLALLNSGGYDEQETLDAVFSAFVRAQRASKKDVFDFASTYDWKRGVGGATDRQQANAVRNIQWANVGEAARYTNSKIGMTAAESTAMRMRQIQERLAELQVRILEKIEPVISKVVALFESDRGKRIMDGLLKLLEVSASLIVPVFEALGWLLDKIQPVIDTFIELIEDVKNWIDDKFGDGGQETSAAAKPQKLANGGITTMPAICGEAGTEMVIPLDYSRNTRAGNIYQTFSQNFNMAGNETSALSLSRAVQTRGFARSMNNVGFLNRRGL